MNGEYNIVLSGEAGQGLNLIEDLIIESFQEKFCVFSSKEFMSRVRGGNNTVEIRISSEKVYAYKEKIDILFLLNGNAFERIRHRIDENTLLIGQKNYLDKIIVDQSNIRWKNLEIDELAGKAGGQIYSNTVVFGYVIGLFNLSKSDGLEKIINKFKNKSIEIIDSNNKAFLFGFDIGLKHRKEISNIHINEKEADNAEMKVIDGTKAIGIGAIAGGCNFMAAYPMSPSTGVLTYLAGKSNDFHILIEQAEDEIAALNMVLGGWYAGARGMVTTSGGGFSLMQEALSLAGITETPCVIHLAQRPGPATGLPTRTEQGDLNLAVYGGHGEFPRIVFSPGKLEDGIRLTQKAFYLADKYQIPVIILTDQFFLDSSGQMEKFIIQEKYLKSFTVKTTKDYKRYRITENGISPRGIPGNGEGLVKVDSDEHNEEGSITEDFNMRIKMNEKRLKKQDFFIEEYEDAELVGQEKYEYLLVGWGSTYGVLEEFIRKSQKRNISFLYIKQVFPLSQKLKKYFDNAQKIIVVENNYSGQFSKLLKLELDVIIFAQILKYNGMPFSIDEINEKVKEVCDV